LPFPGSVRRWLATGAQRRRLPCLRIGGTCDAIAAGSWDSPLLVRFVLHRRAHGRPAAARDQLNCRESPCFRTDGKGSPGGALLSFANLTVERPVCHVAVIRRLPNSRPSSGAG
jgi:hypothetical protein